jgi:hypothetical protein
MSPITNQQTHRIESERSAAQMRICASTRLLSCALLIP